MVKETKKKRVTKKVVASEKANQEEIYVRMREDIEVGQYPSATRLPSVRTLAKKFNASPNTISKVVSRLMESGLCSARRGVGLFVRTLQVKKLTLLVGSKSVKPDKTALGELEKDLVAAVERIGYEVERYNIAIGDPTYGPAVDRIRKPGKVVLCIGISHEPYLKTLSELRRSMVIVGHTPSRTDASSVLSNSFRSGYIAARHLMKNGYRRIAYVGYVRKVRDVVLPEPESLKELAGIQCAFLEEGLKLHSEYNFSHVDEVVSRASSLKEMPDAVIMPECDTVSFVQAKKALGNKLEVVQIGSDSLESSGRAAVVFKKDDLIFSVVEELERLMNEQRITHKNLMIPTNLVNVEE